VAERKNESEGWRDLSRPVAALAGNSRLYQNQPQETQRPLTTAPPSRAALSQDEFHKESLEASIMSRPPEGKLRAGSEMREAQRVAGIICS
jgi:hypothetical protein